MGRSGPQRRRPALWRLIAAVALVSGLGGTASVPAGAAEIDPKVVGVWEIELAGADGARWIWEIAADGQYRLRSDPPGAIPEHQGSARFSGGRWQLSASAGLPGWTDGGNYELRDAQTLVATGRLGRGVWQRTATQVSIPPVQAAEAAPPPEPQPQATMAPDPVAPPEPEPELALTAPAPATVEAAPAPEPPVPAPVAAVAPQAIRERLLAAPTAGLAVPQGFVVQRMTTAVPSPAEVKAGVLDKVELLLGGLDGQSGHIQFLLFADAGAAAAGGDPSRTGLAFDLTVEGREVADDILARCGLWQPEEARSGVRCSRAEPSLPVVVVGAVLQPFAYREITLGSQAQVPARLLQSGTALLRAALGR